MMQVSRVSPEADPLELGPASAIDPCHGRNPRRLDWILAFVAALILSDAFDVTLYVLFGWQAKLVRGVPIARLPLIVVAAVTGILLARDPREATAHLRRTWWLWPAVALAFVSALWSERPAATLVWATAPTTPASCHSLKYCASVLAMPLVRSGPPEKSVCVCASMTGTAVDD